MTTFPSIRRTVLSAPAFLALLLATPAFAGAPTAPIPTEQLVALERTKVDGLFGSPEEKRATLPLYADEFAGIAWSPAGPFRIQGIPTPEYLAVFPTLPHGTFSMSDVHVIPLGPDIAVVTYLSTGPGPDGAPWKAYISSTWAHRDGAWKTVYYQASFAP